MKLYEIDQAFDAWLDEVEANDGEITPELMTKLDCIQAEFGRKVEAYAAIIKTYESEEKLLAAEKARLEARRKTRENSAKRLREALSQTMRLLGREKYKSPKWTLWLQSTSSVEIEDVDALPEEYIKLEKSPKKSEIKEAFALGKEVPGARLETREGVQIR